MTIKKTGDLETFDAIVDALRLLHKNKPNDKSAKDRRYAVTITMMEKAYSYFKTFVVNNKS